ncbi:MAG: uroporphyrinogen-III C-methyltransferase [Candidatus Dormibacteria bacterium]
MSRPVLPGRVYILGAGPGDPELLTLRAAAVLAQADVVFHDQLVSGEVLAIAARAELVDVGHRSGQAKRELQLVAERLAEHARQGRVVARLKGGDPFVFGRGGEEVQALLTLGIASEVVPGISSATAGPAAAGIPVTHRGLATSVVIVTGHERRPGCGIAWERLRGDTVIVLMASGRLEELTAGMVAAGWSATTPAAVVMAATTPQQRQVTGTLADIARGAHLAGLSSPALLVVGEVVSLALVLAPGLLTGAEVAR